MSAEKMQFDAQNRPDLAATLDALKLQEKTPSSVIFYGLSALSREEVEQLKPTWDTLSPVYRRKVMREMAELTETNYELDYRSIGLAGLQDADAGVRAASIDVLWEDVSLELMTALIHIILHDDSRDVRAAAAAALGRFILAGEMGELPTTETEQAQKAALAVLSNTQEDLSVRRRALEAISNCSDRRVPGLIREAYNSPHREMKISAVYAMGRTLDEQWEETVLEEIDSADPEMRYEAARASGEMELVDAVPKLTHLLEEDDRELQLMAVWALGEIGSREALRVLNALSEAAEANEDEDLLESVEEALENASFMDGDDTLASWNLADGGDDRLN